MRNFFKILVTGLACLFFLETAQSQKFEVSWAGYTKAKFDYYDAAELDGGNTLILKLKGKAGLFGKYSQEESLMLVDSKMSTIKEVPVMIEEKDASLRGLEKYGKHVFLFYDHYDPGEKTTTLFALKINDKDLSVDSKINLGSFETENRNSRPQVIYKRSQDSSKLLLFVETPVHKKDNEQFHMVVFDNDLRKLWQKDVELPIPYKFIYIYDQDVTDKGQVYVAIKHYDKEVNAQMVREDGDKIPSYTYKLMVFSKEAPKGSEVSFNMNNNFIQGTKLIYNKNGTVTIAGMYKKKYNGNVTGAFYTTFGENEASAGNLKMIEFPPSLIGLIDHDGFANTRKSDPGLYRNFKIDYILVRKDGSIDLLSQYEKVEIIEDYSTVTHTYTRHTIYTVGDILNIHISGNSDPVYTRIPKKQIANINIFTGYYPIRYQNDLILLYNDDKDNVERDITKKPDDIKKFKNSVLVAATIDPKGDLTRQAIYSNDEEDYITIPAATSKISENSYKLSANLAKFMKSRTKYGILKIE